MDHEMKVIEKYSYQNIKCSVDSQLSDSLESSRLFFKKHGYLIIENLFDPKELYHPVPKERGLFNYFGAVDKYQHDPKEVQVYGSTERYSHPKYKKIHNQIRLILQDILGEELYKTYYYDRFYFVDQELNRHRDRDSCEISISVQIGSNSNNPWPFCLRTLNGEEVSVNLKDGSGVVYMGCDLEHWRDPLRSRHKGLRKFLNKIIKKSDDTYWHQIFFHYVRANGIRAHFFNDTMR